MPQLSQEKASGQSLDLPTERTLSSIPKTSSEKTVWEYPSPQQFYNALVRKGFETPEKEVPTIVEIHNFINEACWEQVMYWESKYHCACKDISLQKFQGRPTDLSPKARLYTLFMGYKSFLSYLLVRINLLIDTIGQLIDVEHPFAMSLITTVEVWSMECLCSTVMFDRH
jgi:cytochrome c heme-lyase